MELLWNAGLYRRSAVEGFAEPVLPKDKTGVKARWTGGDREITYHNGPSSGDSIEPVRSQVSKHPPGIVVIYCGNLPPPFADGPAQVIPETLLCSKFFGDRVWNDNYSMASVLFVGLN